MPSQSEKVQHNVLFEFRDDISQEQIDQLFNTICQLKTENKIPGILSICYGPHDSPEGLNQGFNYGMTVMFENRQARDNYIPHPEHKKVVDMIFPLLKNGTNSIVVVDWFLNENNQV